MSREMPGGLEHPVSVRGAWLEPVVSVQVMFLRCERAALSTGR